MNVHINSPVFPPNTTQQTGAAQENHQHSATNHNPQGTTPVLSRPPITTRITPHTAHHHTQHTRSTPHAITTRCSTPHATHPAPHAIHLAQTHTHTHTPHSAPQCTIRNTTTAHYVSRSSSALHRNHSPTQHN